MRTSLFPEAELEPAEIRIRLRGAAFGYRGRSVISGVDLEIRAGSFIGVTGRNGSGKTTLLRGILGLLAPLSGSVEHSVSSFGYVPQREHLDPVFPLTVEEVVHMGAYGRLSGLRRLSEEDRKLAQAALERVGLSHRHGELFARLSGGQRQRTLIARALVMKPSVLILDEPTSGVDAQAQAQVLDLLETLRHEQDMAVLLVTHDPGRAAAYLRRVLWIEDGGVREIEPREAVAHQEL